MTRPLSKENQFPNKADSFNDINLVLILHPVNNDLPKNEESY